MSNYSFGRICRLTLSGASLSPEPTQEGPVAPNLVEQVVFDSRLGSDIRLTFEIDADDQGEPNKLKASIYNLSPHTRSLLAKGSRILIEGGYASTFGTLFSGYVAKVMSTQDGPDMVTELEAGDGEPFTAYGTTQRSYATRVPLAQMVKDLAADMNAVLSNQSLSLLTGPLARKAMAAKQYARGYAMSGSCADNLDKLLTPAGLQWFVLNGTLTILAIGEPTSVTAVVVSADTGMIGIPSRNENSAVIVKALIDPRLAVGGLINVQSKDSTQTGVFKVSKTHVTGDTHGAAWTVDIEANAVTNTNYT